MELIKMEKILVPTDFSKVANNAVKYALAMNKNLNTEFLFFHAGKENTNHLQENINALNSDANISPDKFHFIASDLDFDAGIVKELVKEHNISLVVMGTHGQGGPIPAKVFGRNTAAVAESSEVPVIAVPPDYLYKTVSRIAYAADLIKFEEELEVVINFAKKHNASVDVFHVTPVYPDIWDTEKKNVDPIIEQTKVDQNFEFIKYHIEETERDNQIKKGIGNFLDEHPVDLLVLFHISRSWIDKFINPSAAVKQITHIRIPVAIFPKKL